ncbi:Tox-REase-5 domain-containing protein [Streptomyces sp. NPDC001741]|uniref:Tox-REase-5 domain-containing protein n=1 Tax=Streptomyces sp. NPDC001741 TaxID=3364605 RepID=UPI0036CD4885
MPQLLRVSRLLVHILFAITVFGGVGLLLTAASVDALDGAVLALTLYGAAPGVAGWVLARKAWTGGVWVWRGLLAVQIWLILGGISSLRDGSLRGLTQMFLPLIILVFLSRAESRQWFRLDGGHREIHEEPRFSLSRMITWRRDRGQSAMEYLGLVTVVAAIILALALGGVGGQITNGLQAAICSLTGSSCPAPGTGSETVEAGDGPADGGVDTGGADIGGTSGTGGADTGGADTGGTSGGTGGDSGGTDGASGGTDSTGGSTGGDSGSTGGTTGGDSGTTGGTTGGDSGTTGGTTGGDSGATGGTTGGDSGTTGGTSGGTGGSTGGDSGATGGTGGTETQPVGDVEVETDEDKTDAAEDEPGWEDDEDSSGEGDKEDDEGCFSGFGAFFSCAGDKVKQVGQGLFVDGIWGDLTGIWDTVTDLPGTWEGLKDYGSSLGDAWSEGTKDAGDKWRKGDYWDALTDWGGSSVDTGLTVLDDMFIGDEVKDQWNNGQKTRAGTTVVWNIGSLFIPGYGEAKIVQKLGKIGKLGKLGKLGEAAQKAGKAAERARKAAGKGDVDEAKKAADEAQEHADDAADELAEKGCLISSGPLGGGRPQPALAGGVNAAAHTQVAYRVNGVPVLLLTEKECDGVSQEEIDAAEQAQKDADAAKEAAKEASRKQVAKWAKPSWYGDLKNPRKGSKDLGDGQWKAKKSVAYWPGMERWMRYQEQVSGVKRGKEYAVKDPQTGRDVDFDGWDSASQTYKEAKFGYGKKVRPDGTLEPAQAAKFVEQAQRQLRAAGDKPVEWNFSNKKVADAAQKAFDDADVDVVVKHTEVKN